MISAYDRLRQRIAGGDETVTTARLDALLTFRGSLGASESDTGAGLYRIKVPRGWRFDIYGITVYVEDAGVFRADYYGAASALTAGSGLSLQIKKSFGTFDMNPVEVTKIGHWGLIPGMSIDITSFATGSNYALITWKPEKADDAIILNGNDSEEFIFNSKANLSTFVDAHYVTVTGTANYIG